MGLTDTFKTCRALVEDSGLSSVAAWKNENPGGRAVGCFPVYIPAEVIHAAGMLPVGLFGGAPQGEIHSDARLRSRAQFAGVP